jgi:hypothetical protein
LLLLSILVQSYSNPARESRWFLLTPILTGGVKGTQESTRRLCKHMQHSTILGAFLKGTFKGFWRMPHLFVNIPNAHSMTIPKLKW